MNVLAVNHSSILSAPLIFIAFFGSEPPIYIPNKLSPGAVNLVVHSYAPDSVLNVQSKLFIIPIQAS